jgi:hypothetical protein
MGASIMSMIRDVLEGIHLTDFEIQQAFSQSQSDGLTPQFFFYMRGRAARGT